MNLTDEQQVLVDSNDKIVVGLACPGSGKTTTLIKKAERYIDRGAKGLITTFTRKVKEEIESRLDNNLFEVETIHGFAYRVVRSNWNRLEAVYGRTQWPEKPILVTEEEENAIIKELFDEGDKWVNILKYLRKLKLTPPELIHLVNSGVYLRGLKRNQIEQFEKYENFRLSKGILVFDNLIPLAQKLLLLPEVNHNVYDNYDVVLVDEAQDIDCIQWSILEPFLIGIQDMFVIGDFDQSIFSYSGGNGAVLNNLINHPNSVVYSLSYNFRSGKRIVELANKIQNKNMIAKQVFDGGLFINKCDSIEKEAEEIRYRFNSNCVVLARTNKYLDEIRDYLPGYRLMTVHQSKGKEWDNVALVGCNDSIFPLHFSNDFITEKNLFYVGCTRAKKNLMITYTDKPSIFLKDL